MPRPDYDTAGPPQNPTIHQPTAPADPDHGQPGSLARGGWLGRVIVGALALLLLMPTALSSWSLLAFAERLGLPWPLRPVLPLAFDAVAICCIGATVYAAWRYRERAGLLKLLVWAFAAGSAALNYLHGQAMTAQGAAPVTPWVFGGLSLAGPGLLEIMLTRWRRWMRRDLGELGFGARWLPGVGFASTLAAWRLAVRDRLEPAEAVRRVEARRALRSLSEPERIAYALGELRSAAGDPDPAHMLRLWLEARRVTVGAEALAAAVDARHRPQIEPRQPAASAPPERTTTARPSAPRPRRGSASARRTSAAGSGSLREHVERVFLATEARTGVPLRPAEVARQLGRDPDGAVRTALTRVRAAHTGQPEAPTNQSAVNGQANGHGQVPAPVSVTGLDGAP